MRIRLLPVLLLCGVIQVAAQRPAFITPGETYFWPTDASDLLSATFAETRSQHFHAGIDVKTWGKSGFDVYATRDGVIWRASVTQGGYGKMLVMKHNDGSFSLYAHLDDFEPRLQAMVDSIRYATGIGEIDTVFTRRKIRYRKGELIAFSGSTGIGPPHLHFELRSPLNRPFNPLLAGLEVKDHVKPTFTQLGAEVVSPFGRVEGRPDFFAKKALRRGATTDFGTLRATGDIGLSAVTFDQADGAANTYAVYELEVALDERRIFHARVDSFGFEQTGQMFLDRVYPQLRSRSVFFQRLWVRDGNTVPYYDRIPGNGVIRDDGRRHDVRIKARDFAGNETIATLTVDFTRPLPEVQLHPPRPLQGRSTGGLIEQSLLLNTSDWSIFRWPDGTRFHSFEMMLAGSRQPQTSNEVLLHAATSDFMATNGAKKAYFFRILPGSASEVQLPDQSLRIRFSAASVYDTTLVGVETFSFDGQPAFFIHPENEPTAGRIQVEMLLPDGLANRDTYRLYHLSPRWAAYRGRDSRSRGGILTGIIQDFGLHVALPDTTPPSVSAPSLIRNRQKQYLISIPVRDNLSGIDTRLTRVVWDGQQGFTEYEPDKARLLFKHPNLRPGAAPVVISAIDRSGNRREYRYTLGVSSSSGKKKSSGSSGKKSTASKNKKRRN